MNSTIMNFSRRQNNVDDLILTLPVLLEKDYKDAVNSRLCLGLPKKYTEFIKNFESINLNSEFFGKLESFNTIEAYLTTQIYIPKHYQMIDSLFNIYDQIQRLTIKLKDMIGKEQDTKVLKFTSYYIRITELVNCIVNNPRFETYGG